MSQEALNQADVFLSCMAAGLLSGAIFDLFKIIRRTVGIPFAVNLCDACFWMFYGVFFVSFIYRVNNASLRWYVFAALIAGAGIYFVALSKFFLAIGLKTAEIIVKIFKTVMKILFLPFKFILKRTGKAAVVILVPLRNFNKKLRALRRKFNFGKKLLKKI